MAKENFERHLAAMASAAAAAAAAAAVATAATGSTASGQGKVPKICIKSFLFGLLNFS